MPVAEGLLLCCEHGVAYAVIILYAGKTVFDVRDFLIEAAEFDVVRYGPAIVGSCQVCRDE